MHPPRVTGEEDSGLASRIARAHKNDIAPFTKIRLDRCRPVRDAGSFEPVEIFDLRSPIACTGCDHHGSSIDRNAVVEFNAMHWGPRTIELDNRDGNRELSPKLLCLDKRARGERLAGNSSRESQIILDS